jgi:hypothetical protein
MDVNKIVWKAILTAFLSALSLIIIMLCALCLFFPSTMMQVSYNMGFDKMSASFAKTAYDRTNDIYYIVYATEVSIGIDDEDGIIEYGELLVGDDEFSQYCARKNANLPSFDNHQATGAYEQYVYSKICISMYQEDAIRAIKRAFASLGVEEGTTQLSIFPRQNAVMALYVHACLQNDAQTVSQIKGKIEELQVNLSEADSAYYDEMLAFMQRENG